MFPEFRQRCARISCANIALEPYNFAKEKQVQAGVFIFVPYCAQVTLRPRNRFDFAHVWRAPDTALRVVIFMGHLARFVVHQGIPVIIAGLWDVLVALSRTARCASCIGFGPSGAQNVKTAKDTAPVGGCLFQHRHRQRSHDRVLFGQGP